MAPPCCRLFPNSPCISKRGRTASAFGSPGLCLQKGRVRWVLLALSSSCLCSWLCCPVFAISSRQHTYKSYRFEVAYGWLLAAGKERSLSAEDGLPFSLRSACAGLVVGSAQTVRATGTCDSRIRGRSSSQTLSFPTCEPRQPPCRFYVNSAAAPSFPVSI